MNVSEHYLVSSFKIDLLEPIFSGLGCAATLANKVQCRSTTPTSLAPLIRPIGRLVIQGRRLLAASVRRLRANPAIHLNLPETPVTNVRDAAAETELPATEGEKDIVEEKTL